MADERAGLPLADFIGALRAELREAALAKDPQLQFNVGPVNVEFTLMTRHEGGGKAGIRFWVVEAGASDLPRAFRTADLWLIHAADCCSRYSSWTCCGVRY